MPARLVAAEAGVKTALRNLDLSTLTWVPADLDGWKHAEARLIAVQKELTLLTERPLGWVLKTDGETDSAGVPVRPVRDSH